MPDPKPKVEQLPHPEPGAPVVEGEIVDEPTAPIELPPEPDPEDAEIVGESKPEGS